VYCRIPRWPLDVGNESRWNEWNDYAKGMRDQDLNDPCAESMTDSVATPPSESAQSGLPRQLLSSSTAIPSSVMSAVVRNFGTAHYRDAQNNRRPDPS
jgi:hypothetical protein